MSPDPVPPPEQGGHLVIHEKPQWQSPHAVPQGNGVMVTVAEQLSGGFTVSQSHPPETTAPENVPPH